MPKLSRRHVIAALRRHLNLTQGKLADLVGVSVDLIKSVEVKRVPLSERLARKISSATGVRLDWLLRDDVAIPPSSTYTNDYGLEFFQSWKARRSLPLEADLREYVPVYFLAKYVVLRGVAEAAAAKGEHDIELLMYEFEEFLLEARKKYGTLPGFGTKSNVFTIDPDQLGIVSKDIVAAQKQINKESKLRPGSKPPGAPANTRA